MNDTVRILYAAERFHVQFRALFRAAKPPRVNRKTSKPLFSLLENGAARED